jgi:hypothetical protein
MPKKKSSASVKAKKKPVKKVSGEKSPTSQLGSVLSFRWLRKMLHSKFRSMDLLDLWILKKNWVSLFV